MLESGLNEAWNPTNAPLRMDPSYVANLDRLPLSGRLSVMPWTDTYWPSNRGGISQRWYTNNPQNFSYQPPSADQVRNMSNDQLAQLSPAEKYDIYMGRYDYPTVKSERARTSPNLASWEGLCHGWAPASYLFSEPGAVTLAGVGGVGVPFGSSDVKALITYTQALLNQSPVRGLGARCDTSDLNSPACRDANAGAFHVVLANQIGIRQQSFLIDINRDYQVWNQPITSYTSQVRGYQNPSPGAAIGTVREALVESSVTYAVESNPTWRAAATAFNTKNYSYRLELNSNNDIIGGEWFSADRPDFLWQQGRPNFTGYFAGVQQVYNASVGGARVPANGGPVGAPNQPVGELLAPLECPESFVPANVGTSGGRVCANDREVSGPFTSAMITRCEQWGGGSACLNNMWARDMALNARGNFLCPMGATYDSRLRYCVEGTSVLGPFPSALRQECLRQGIGDVCNQPRWDRLLLLSILG